MEIYTIKEGHHYSVFNIHRLLMLDKRYFKREIVFSEGCFKSIAPPEMSGWNKLTGVFQFPFIHYNSVRFGWRATDQETIRIAPYLYIKGERIILNDSAEIKEGDKLKVEGYHNGQRWIMNTYVNGDIVNTQSIATSKPRGLWCKCYPYYGGDATAPVECVVGVCEV